MTRKILSSSARIGMSLGTTSKEGRPEVVAATFDLWAQPLSPAAATLPRKFRRFITLLAGTGLEARLIVGPILR